MIIRLLAGLSITLCIICSACVPESKKVLTTVDLNCADPVFRTIMGFEYSQNTDSLLAYLSHEDPTYRYLASRSFASTQDEAALDSLYSLLYDPVIKVRAMAAYAIGQIGNPASADPLILAFRQRDTMSVDNSANGAILEAIGKLGDKKLAELLVEAQGYRETDTLLMRGKMRSLYRFVLRDIYSDKMIAYLVESLKKDGLDPEARLYAAHCLARINKLDIEKIKFQIAEIFTGEQNKNIKMALALALRNTRDKEIQSILLTELDSETDNRVRINILKALSQYSYIESAEQVTELLRSEDVQLARQAARFLYQNGIKEDVSYYRQISREDIPWQVRAEILNAINKLLPYYYTKTLNSVRWEIQQLIKDETDQLIISHYIRALSHDPAAYEWIIEQYNASEDEVIRTACIETIGSILADENFNGTFQSYATYHRRKVLDFLRENMRASADQGIIGAAAEIIANKASQLYEIIDSTDFLFEARELLKNPDHIESIHAVERAIATVRGIKTPDYTPVAAARIPNWELLENYDKNTKLIVKTSKGAFTMDLFLEHSPSTVLNFLELASENYFDGKLFHRVVPNFVVQTGSPRGDNYGGEEYVISSELGPMYYNKTGLVGMASAGRHTESTQWFITHSPSPHLDGKYTIFAQLTDGKEVISQLQIGDTIEDIIISNLQS